jgi:hypothetical protein
MIAKSNPDMKAPGIDRREELPGAVACIKKVS